MQLLIKVQLTHIIQQFALHTQLPRCNAAFRVLCIRLGRVKRVGDVETQFSLLLEIEKKGLSKYLSSSKTNHQDAISMLTNIQKHYAGKNALKLIIGKILEARHSE